MKITFDGIEEVFDCNADFRYTLVIENPRLMYAVVSDIEQQLCGAGGKTVLSEDNVPLSLSRNLEMLTQFIPFDINRKGLINRIVAEMIVTARQEEYYMQIQELVAQWEKICMSITLSMPGDFNFTKISPEALLKGAGVEIENNYDRLTEKLLDYFELVENYDAKKLFVLVNLRSYVENQEMELFLEEIIQRDYAVLFIEGAERQPIKYEKKYIVDADLCSIC